MLDIVSQVVRDFLLNLVEVVQCEFTDSEPGWLPYSPFEFVCMSVSNKTMWRYLGGREAFQLCSIELSLEFATWVGEHGARCLHYKL